MRAIASVVGAIVASVFIISHGILPVLFLLFCVFVLANWGRR